MTKGTRKRQINRAFRDTSTGKYVIRALSNEKYDYRTAEGIAREVKISVREVKTVLGADKRVRTSIIKSKKGKSLYTLKSKKSAVGDAFSAFRAMSSDKMRG